MSHSINIENLYRAGISIAFAVRSFDLFTRLILWIEERDSDQKVLLAERINPTGITARYQDFLPCAGDDLFLLNPVSVNARKGIDST